MTDLNPPNSADGNPTARTVLNQRPSLIRWNDPIARLPFLGHWLLGSGPIKSLAGAAPH